MNQFTLPSNDGVNNLHVCEWKPEGEVKGVLQISHGMIEFIERYDGFAQFLNTKGIVVYGNDHLGHGHTAKTDDDLGYFCKENMSETVVKDLHTVTEYAKKQYPGVPYIFFGHSMGSFLARRYLMTYGTEVDAGIICGSGSTPGAVLGFAKFTCAVIKLFHGDRYRSNFVKNSSFAGYLKRINPVRTSNDWLTKDEAIVDWYNAQKFCTFTFTINGYNTLFDTITYIQKPENIAKVPKDLPVFYIAGEDDPVGAYGEGVKQAASNFVNAGVKDVTVKLYPGDRHEILNELDKETVYNDVYEWIVSKGIL